MYNFGQTLIANFDEFAVFKSALTQEQIISLYTYAPEGYTAPTYTAVEMLDTTTPLVWTGDFDDIMAKADFRLHWDNYDLTNGDIKVVEPFLDDTGKWTIQPWSSVEGGAELNDPSLYTPITITNTFGDSTGHGVYFEVNSRLEVPEYKLGTDSFTIVDYRYVHLIGGSKDSYTDVQLWGTRNPVNDETGAGFAFVQGVDRQFTWFDAVGAEDGAEIKTDYLERATLGNIFMQWIQIAVTVDRENNVAQFYINGRPYGGQTDISAIAGQSLDTELPFSIGSTLNYYHKSVSTDFAIFKEVLTADEIATIYATNAGLEPVEPTDPVDPVDPVDPGVTDDPEVVDPGTDDPTDEPSAPQTFDIAIVAAVASIISLAGFVVAKKH
ncbi:MAG: LamG domain-containing protein [Ruminococcaceae bacterium]|nr:LamG domain-containing protein [Oscillospiraceae bacterium]